MAANFHLASLIRACRRAGESTAAALWLTRRNIVGVRRCVLYKRYERTMREAPQTPNRLEIGKRKVENGLRLRMNVGLRRDKPSVAGRLVSSGVPGRDRKL